MRTLGVGLAIFMWLFTVFAFWKTYQFLMLNEYALSIVCALSGQLICMSAAQLTITLVFSKE